MCMRIEKSNGLYEIIEEDDGAFVIYLTNEEGRELIHALKRIKSVDHIACIPTSDDLRAVIDVHSAITAGVIPPPSNLLTQEVAYHTGLDLPYGYGVDWVACGKMYLTALRRGLIDRDGFENLLNELYGWCRIKEKWMQFS